MITDPGLAAYLIRVSLALVVLSLLALFVVRCSRKRRQGVRDGVVVEILTSLPLGKDVFFVVRCGPDVLAFTSGAGGACLMGRWKYEEWVCAGGASEKSVQEGAR